LDKIVCVGKNYKEHAKELGDAVPDFPVIFLKPPSILRASTGSDEATLVKLPKNLGSVHYEAEIVLRIAKGGYKLDAKEAEKSIGAVTLGLDLTLRDLQATQKKNGHPWTTSKVFPDSAVVGPWVRVAEFPDFMDQQFAFSLDGKVSQSGYGNQMTLDPAQCVAYISQFFPLSAGDLIFTGTPAGVGPLLEGQKGSLSWGPIKYAVQFY
jgi:2-keto-4-pentenoate hydratase/2-oxohepta-3-ene-1,7-dioic acid hydratase in catechol pathway